MKTRRALIVGAMAALLSFSAAVPAESAPTAAQRVWITKMWVGVGPSYWLGLSTNQRVRVSWNVYNSKVVGDYYP